MANNKSCVYIHIFPNGKVYIGQTSQTTAQRWVRGKGYKGQLVERAIKKYGWDNIEHKVLCSNLSEDEANALEVALIKKYRSTDEKYGYNLLDGGKGKGQNLSRSPEHYKRIAEINSKKVDCYKRDGTKVGTFGSVNSAAEFVGGSFRVVSACCRGSKKSGYGYVWRFHGEPFDKYDVHNKKGGVKGFPVIMLTTDGEELARFKSVKATSLATGIREDVIAKVCRGELSERHGFVFYYADEKISEENINEEGNQGV